MANDQKFQANAFTTVKMVYQPRVMRKSFLRPSLSVKYPKTIAPITAPAM